MEVEPFEDRFKDKKVVIVTARNGSKYVEYLERCGLTEVYTINAYAKSLHHVKQMMASSDVFIVVRSAVPHEVTNIIRDYGLYEKGLLLDNHNNEVIYETVKDLLERVSERETVLI